MDGGKRKISTNVIQYEEKGEKRRQQERRIYSGKIGKKKYINRSNFINFFSVCFGKQSGTVRWTDCMWNCMYRREGLRKILMSHEEMINLV